MAKKVDDKWVWAYNTCIESIKGTDMYTFNPLASIPVDHTGFFLVCFISVVILCICLMTEPESFFFWFFCVTVLTVGAYFVSYSWTDQTPKTFKNEKVTGEFVGFQPEGYREKSGKSMVDRHYMYVVYRVNGNDVILQAKQGVEYPKTAILYKN
jgi:hypothetical protein